MLAPEQVLPGPALETAPLTGRRCQAQVPGMAPLLAPVWSPLPGELLLALAALQEQAMEMLEQVPVLESLLALVPE
jgi:hypothetical protein